MAPEMLAGHSYDGRKTDIFATGVTLFIMATCQYPFEEATLQDEKYAYIANNDAIGFWNSFEKIYPLTSELKDLLFGMLTAEPSQRYTLHQIILHPWVVQEEVNFMNLINVGREIQDKFQINKNVNY